MQVEGDEVHETAEEARAGATPNVTRWVLTFGLLGAIVLLTIIWVTGALVTGPEKTQNAGEMIRQQQENAGPSGTDSVVSGGANQMNATTPGESTDPQNTPNKNAGQ
jgi:hypothetical protein